LVCPDFGVVFSVCANPSWTGGENDEEVHPEVNYLSGTVQAAESGRAKCGPSVMIRGKGDIVILAVSVLTFMMLPLIAKHVGLAFNNTSSVPTGFYQTALADKYKYVGVCLPSQTVQVAIRAGIKIAPRGNVRDGHRPILKRLYSASVERPIEFSQRGFRVDGWHGGCQQSARRHL
jgi:hypothetical protein